MMHSRINRSLKQHYYLFRILKKLRGVAKLGEDRIVNRKTKK